MGSLNEDKDSKVTNASDGFHIHQLPSANQNFGLTQMQFEAVVTQLKEGDESIFERIFLSHFSDCMSYLMKQYKASHDLAYDISMDTIIEFRKKMLAGKISYGNLRYLFTKIASQLYLKSISKEIKLKNYIIEEGGDIEVWEEKLLSLEKAWASLNEEDQKLLHNYYYMDISLNKIAESENKTDSSIRKQKQRTLDKLRSIFFTIYTY